VKRLFYYFSFISVIIIACKSGSSGENKIKIENKTNKAIVCVLGYNYPDLTLEFTNKQDLQTKESLLNVDGAQTKEIDTLGLCKKEVWDNTIKHSMLMLFVFDKNKLEKTDKLDDALVRRYYFSYAQLIKTNGIITIDSTRTNNL
jgi:hypothetical protein